MRNVKIDDGDESLDIRMFTSHALWGQILTSTPKLHSAPNIEKPFLKRAHFARYIAGAEDSSYAMIRTHYAWGNLCSAPNVNFGTKFDWNLNFGTMKKCRSSFTRLRLANFYPTKSKINLADFKYSKKKHEHFRHSEGLILTLKKCSLAQ